MKKYNGKITYTMDKNHPDIKHVKDWMENKEFTFEDVYMFSEETPFENIKEFIKRDLKTVAGGGYDAKHIHNISFEIKKA